MMMKTNHYVLSNSADQLQQYETQITSILKDRYVTQLGYGASLTDMTLLDTLHKLGVSELILNFIDDAIVSILGTSDNRLKLFATNREIESPFIATLIAKNLMDYLSVTELFFETTEELYKKLMVVAKIYKRKNDIRLYIYPAEASALAIPGRRLRVLADGVYYEKYVPLADTFAKKIVAGTMPQLYGITGFESIEDASVAANYKSKFIMGKRGVVLDMEFKPDKWGGLYKSI